MKINRLNDKASQVLIKSLSLKPHKPKYILMRAKTNTKMMFQTLMNLILLKPYLKNRPIRKINFCKTLLNEFLITYRRRLTLFKMKSLIEKVKKNSPSIRV